MAQKKASEVDRWLARPEPAFRLVLIYGPDRGLVSERARAFAAKTGLPLDDPFAVVRLDANELDQQPGRLENEARTVPMFADWRLIWISNAGAQKALAADVKRIADEPPPDAVILIEAGELKKNAALRTAVEGAAAAMALPCYADDAKAVDLLIDEEMSKAGMAIGLDARHALKASLGGDRLASRGEIAKLLLYCLGKEQVELEDVLATTGDVSASSNDEAVDAVLLGQAAGLDLALSRHAAAGGHPFQLLAAAIRQFQSLQAMRETMERKGQSAAAAVASARPPVFFARKRAVEGALERFDGKAMARALDRLRDAVLQTRRRPDLAGSVTGRILLALALEGRRPRG
ncbi:MAG: DNA polymerase III subunit delta [Rhizobiales bacterium 65-79]|mgnify:CR=1 FL=1|jgi:DNA polymerase-3 subunit delta|nr:DNA polymerase III subunit delta [Hyphomicrobiales bacterium]OJU04700.1 MAG: DNA polymerase III subunit delta [Rhizobiales bacterium 65-79]